MFARRLSERVAALGSLCVGLDPRLEEMTASERALLATDPEGALVLHGQRLLEATRAVAAAYKPNAAFYEVHGSAGWRALERLVPELEAVAPVILDAKRGDIGTTSAAYAKATRRLGATAVTVSPWLGQDGVAPFLDEGLFVFVLARTSNDAAAAVQMGGLEPAWEAVVRLAMGWGASDDLGFVVGATMPRALARARVLAPEHWLLAPGVGAQGASPAETLAAAGGKVLVPVSRAISAATDPGVAAIDLARALRVSPRANPTSAVQRHRELVDGLFDRGCVRFGEFTLKSGARSPIYLDLRRLVAMPDLMVLAARAYAEVMAPLRYDQIAALPYAALPIGAAVSLCVGRPMLYPRREAKGYGTQASIEGVFEVGQRALVLDDVATRGDSKVEAFERLEAAGLLIEDVVVLIDREGGARELMAAHGKRMHAVFGLRELLGAWRTSGRIDDEQVGAVERFLRESA
jgi:uridine monophosphate synthetase